MAHYAFLDNKNIVIEVIQGRDETEVIAGVTDWEAHYSHERGLKCLRTSYTSRGGNRINPETGEVLVEGEHYRYNYAGIGFFYDKKADAFVPPKPEIEGNWVLNKNSYLWELIEETVKTE